MSRVAGKIAMIASASKRHNCRMMIYLAIQARIVELQIQITTAAISRTQLFKDCFRFNQVEVVYAFIESGVHRI